MQGKRKIKVLHVVEALGGGVYSYFTDLSHVMAMDPRVITYVAYSNKRNEIDAQKVDSDLHADTQLILLDMNKEISISADLRGIRQIVDTIKKVEPDIVHLHSSKAGILGKIAVWISNFNGPSYYTPHGYAFLRQDISQSKRFFYKWIEHLFARFSKTVTVACGDTEWSLAVRMKSTARLIRNGIRLEQIKDVKRHLTLERLTLGTLGRISYQKNPSRFNDFARQLPKNKFLWIGSGDLKNQITSPNVEITGWFTQKSDAVPYLKKLDVYVQTSLWEGLPIAVIEAMAMGLPVIASDVIGNKDLVDHGRTGFLISQNSQLHDFVRQLENVDVRDAMGKAARKRVEELYDCEKNFSQLVDLYLCDLSSIR